MLFWKIILNILTKSLKVEFLNFVIEEGKWVLCDFLLADGAKPKVLLTNQESISAFKLTRKDSSDSMCAERRGKKQYVQ